jgi:succinoglycan biosynthesis transport protein ExoP
VTDDPALVTGATAVVPARPLQLRAGPPLGELPGEEIDLRRVWRVVCRERRTIAAAAALLLMTSLLASVLARPVYRSTALVEVRPHSRGVIRLRGMEGLSAAQHRDFLETQFRIIRSKSVAGSTLNRVGLAEVPEFAEAAAVRGVGARLTALWLRLRGAAPPQGQDGTSELARAALIDVFLDHLTVRPVRDSTLVEVSFDSRDPQLATRVVNALVEEYIRLGEERRFASIAASREFLQGELANARSRLELSERELNEFARKHDIVDVGDSMTLASSRVGELSSELSAIVGRRIQAESAHRQLAAAAASQSAPILSSELIQKLKDERAQLSAEYARLSGIYLEEYPPLVQLGAKLRDLDTQLAAETDNVAASLSNEYERSTRAEQLLRSELEREKQALAEVKERAVEHGILKREWETSRQVYVSLLEQLKEMDITAGLDSDQIAVIDRAALPAQPHRPRPLLNAALALLVGLGLGVAAAFLREYLDEGIRTADELESATGLASLGVVPKAERGQFQERYLGEAYARFPDAISESLRAVRTNLIFSVRASEARVLQITSALPGEGKTSTAATLAVLLAHAGFRVLLIDADLRRPRVHEVFGLAREPGLSDLLSGAIEGVLHKSPVRGLSVIPAGSPVIDPVEVLSALDPRRLQAGAPGPYDFVLVDSAPVLGLADSVVIATKVDAVLLVVSAEDSVRGALGAAVKHLRLVRAPLLGAVLNKAEREGLGYGAGYYGYGQRSADAAPAAG